MNKKVLILVVVIITCLCILSSCSVKRYNATIYCNAENSFRKEFLEYNIPYGSYYHNDNGEFVKADGSYDYTFVAETKEHAEEFFYEFPFETNFDEQMLIIYIFTDVYSRPYDIKKISYNHGELRIDVKLQNVPFPIGDTSMPHQRVIVIQMNKLDCNTVIVNKFRK